MTATLARRAGDVTQAALDTAVAGLRGDAEAGETLGTLRAELTTLAAAVAELTPTPEPVVLRTSVANHEELIEPDATDGPIIDVSAHASPDDQTDQQAGYKAALTAASGGRLVFPPGNWWISAEQLGALVLPANTTIHLQAGAVVRQIATNLHASMAIFRMDAANTHIRGAGSIIGDQTDHIIDNPSAPGENTFMIWVSHNASAWSIVGPTISKSWGDGIYVGGFANSSAADGGYIDHVTVNDCRRQGISVVWSHDLVIGDFCEFSDIGKGAAERGLSRQRPTCGIDVEPDTGKNVLRLKVGAILVKGCYGNGITVQSPFTENGANAEFFGSRVENCGLNYPNEGQAHALKASHGIEVKEGGYGEFTDVTSTGNLGDGFAVYGAVGGRTFQGKMTAVDCVSHGNNGWGLRLQNDANGGGNVVTGMRIYNNGFGPQQLQDLADPDTVTGTIFTAP